MGQGPGSRAGEFIEWLAVKDPKQAVLDDISRIRSHPLIPKSIPVYGYIYDVRSGQLLSVPTDGGRAERPADKNVLFDDGSG